MKKILSVRNFLFLLPLVVETVLLPSLSFVYAADPATDQRAINLNQGPLGGIGPNQIIQFIIYGAFALAILAALVYLIWGGINWILSGGDKEKVDAARKRIVAAIVGLILVALAVAILNFVLVLLGFCGLFNFQLPTLKDATFTPGQCPS